MFVIEQSSRFSTDNFEQVFDFAIDTMDLSLIRFQFIEMFSYYKFELFSDCTNKLKPMIESILYLNHQLKLHASLFFSVFSSIVILQNKINFMKLCHYFRKESILLTGPLPEKLIICLFHHQLWNRQTNSMISMNANSCIGTNAQSICL